MKPKVTLVSHTRNPIETIYMLWEASKGNRPLQDIAFEAYPSSPLHRAPKQVREVFLKVLEAKIPVAENVSFTFMLEGVSISFREQMVRHRIGVKVGDRLGVDFAPDLADSTWWSQSMRILDMGSFASDGEYRVPDSLRGKKVQLQERVTSDAEVLFDSAMHHAQAIYNKLVSAGVPAEDAREVIPLAATHRISWTLNLSALQHIVGKRGCWILQGDLWEPIIRGMVEELAEKIDPIFRTLIAPPCVKGGKYVGCCFKIDNERRVDGRDKIPPCSLYLGMENGEDERVAWAPSSAEERNRFEHMREQYGRLWNRNPDTYEAVAVQE